MGSNNNLINLKKALVAFNENDLEMLRKYVADSATYTIHGKSIVSGTFIGIDNIVSALARIKELTNGTMKVVPEVLLAGENEIMAYYKVSGRRPGGKEYENHQAYLYKFHEGKLIEGHTIPVDQYAFDFFFKDK